MTIRRKLEIMLKAGLSMGELQRVTGFKAESLWDAIGQNGWQHRWQAAKRVRTMGGKKDPDAGMWYVGRNWTPDEIERFIAMYPTAVSMYDIGNAFDITTAKAVSFAKRLRDGGREVGYREKTGNSKADINGDRVDYRISGLDVVGSLTIGGDAEVTNPRALAYARDGYTVERIGG